MGVIMKYTFWNMLLDTFLIMLSISVGVGFIVFIFGFPAYLILGNWHGTFYHMFLHQLENSGLATLITFLGCICCGGGAWAVE
jgi:hypothetical protein